MDTINEYLQFCESQKRLDKKTLKAYRIDLCQFAEHVTTYETVTHQQIETYISELNKMYKAKTVKRKIASVKAFYRYLEYKELVAVNPFTRLQIKLREPVTLPKVIPLTTIERLLLFMHEQKNVVTTELKRKVLLRDTAVIELLFATGIRISELCALRPCDVDLNSHNVLIHGKGGKERRIQIGNISIIEQLQEYERCYRSEIRKSGYYWVNRCGRRLTEQSVREMLRKYCSAAAINMHITPHMFRHSFATYLLEADVDIRYIQEMMGHSSITITEIYTHVAMSKQKHILEVKHPRHNFAI